jgi:hypothetical protein
MNRTLPSTIPAIAQSHMDDPAPNAIASTAPTGPVPTDPTATAEPALGCAVTAPLSPGEIGLDTMCTATIFCDLSHLSDEHEAPTTIEMHGVNKGGKGIRTNVVGDTTFGPAYFSDKASVNLVINE